MNTEVLRSVCCSLPHVTEDIKWGSNLCFLIAEKIFCICDLENPFQVSLKIREEDFEELCSKDGIIQAPYMAQKKWVMITNANCFTLKEWEHYIAQSYNLVKGKLPKSVRKKYKIE